MRMLVYDSPASRLDAERSTPQGEYEKTLTRSGSVQRTVTDYRCFADCGPVLLEISTLGGNDGDEFRTWVNDAVTTGQTGLESIFGACPASDDVAANPPTVGTWPPFASTTSLPF